MNSLKILHFLIVDWKLFFKICNINEIELIDKVINISTGIVNEFIDITSLNEGVYYF